MTDADLILAIRAILWVPNTVLNIQLLGVIADLVARAEKTK